MSAPQFVRHALQNDRDELSRCRGIKSIIYDILKEDHPATVRGTFYQLVNRGVIEKTQAEYQQTVVRLLTDVRVKGETPVLLDRGS
jgi:DNA topoisomerase VI subunit A